jgi:phage tail protein X
MSIRVSALADESLDALVWRATGGGAGAVEATLAAYPGLAAISLALPERTEFEIPDNAPPAAPIDIIQLWD